MTSTGVPLGLSWLPSVVGNWVPGARPLQPYQTFNFVVEIEGLLASSSPANRSSSESPG